MKHIAKKITASVLLMLLVLPLTLNVSAHGGAGGVSQPGSPQTYAGDFPYVMGYGFRVFLYDTEGTNYLWEGNEPYKSKANMASVLDASASQSAFYLNVGAEYKAYDEQYSDTPWVGVDVMSAETFNTMPGMSGYTNPTGSYKDTNFDTYAAVFNQLDEKAGTKEGMQEILDWFSSKGVNTSSYKAETTLVIVEPVVKWSYAGGYFTLTYQNIRKYDETRKGCFSFFNFTPSLARNCIVSGDRKIPQANNDCATSYINGYLGAFYQSWVCEAGDCITQSYDSTSGYAYYGCSKIADPAPEPTPTPKPTPQVIEEVSVNGDLKLQDYQLNYVYPNVAKALGSYTTITKNEWTYSSGNSVFCGVCDRTVGSINYSKSYNITVKDTSSGPTIIKDNSLTGTKVLLYNTANGTFDTRNVLLAGKSINTASSTTYVVDYGFNLVRSVFGDKRVVSTISNQTIGESYAKNVLGLSYGNKPIGVSSVSSTRNSFAVFGKIKDTLGFNAVFSSTGSTRGYQSYNTYTHTCHDDNDTEDITTDDVYGSETVHSLVQDKTLNAFSKGTAKSTTFSLDVNSVAYKYSTKNSAVGKNAVSGLFNKQQAVNNGISRKLNRTYGFGVVQNSSINLKVYPEVKMMAYEYSGNKINGLGSVTPREVITMGEQLRTIQSSSLYLYTVKSNESALADMSGFTYSDTAETGDFMLGADKIVMNAGGDFTFVGDSNFTINLYGYSLDVVNKGFDGGGFKISKTETIPYSEVIADSSDVYKQWGNEGSTSLLSNAFKAWASKVMSVDNYACDLDLELVGGNYYHKTYNNFSATFGSFTSWLTHQDMCFPIRIKNGSVDTSDRGYIALIKSISTDYGCTEAEAIKVFNNSGLCNAIYDAIESSKSGANKSQSGVSTLGNNSHWYDEQVKTIVVRRYMTDPIYVRGITCADKIDFGAVQSYDSLDSFVDAKWFFTLYFTEGMTELGDFVVYNPALASQTRQQAIDSGGIIVDRLYVNGADFYIGKGTTYRGY